MWPGCFSALICGITSHGDSSLEVQNGWSSGTARHMKERQAQYCGFLVSSRKEKIHSRGSVCSYRTARAVVVFGHLRRVVTRVSLDSTI